MIRVTHDLPAPVKPYMICGMGLYYNKELQKAKPGSVIIVEAGFRREKYRIVNKTVLKNPSQILNFMIRSIYGSVSSWGRLYERWVNDSVILGCGVDGVSQQECMLIEVEPYIYPVWQKE